MDVSPEEMEARTHPERFYGIKVEVYPTLDPQERKTKVYNSVFILRKGAPDEDPARIVVAITKAAAKVGRSIAQTGWSKSQLGVEFIDGKRQEPFVEDLEAAE